MKQMKYTWLASLCAVAMMHSMSAYAGFVDATSGVAASKGAVSLARVQMAESAFDNVGLYQAPAGDWGVEAAGDGVRLADALAKLVPINGMTFDGDAVVLSKRVSWGGGSRRAALESIAGANFLNITFEDKVIHVRQRAVQFGLRFGDGNFRKAIKRWSAMAGWTFSDDLWRLAKDIPVGGEVDSYGVDFKESVRALMRATEQTRTPGRPCFHSNKVVRIVPRTELCARLRTDDDN